MRRFRQTTTLWMLVLTNFSLVFEAIPEFHGAPDHHHDGLHHDCGTWYADQGQETDGGLKRPCHPDHPHHHCALCKLASPSLVIPLLLADGPCLSGMDRQAWQGSPKQQIIFYHHSRGPPAQAHSPGSCIL